MKKWLLMIMLLCLFSCSTSSPESKVFKDVSVYEVNEQIQKQDENSFLLLVTSDRCYTCDELEKVLTSQLEKQNLTIYRLKVNVDEDNKDILKAIEELEVTTGRLNQLPTTYYVYQGSVSIENTKEGYIEKGDLLLWLKDLHLIQ